MEQKPNIHHEHPVSQGISITMCEKEAEMVIKKNRMIRILYIVGGTASLIFAVLGVVLPGLPVTPFALLSAFLYAKSSPKLYDWLLSNKVLGPKIKNYHRRKGVTRKGKGKIIALMSAMVLFSSFVVVDAGPLRWLILSLGLIGGIVVWFFVPTAQND